VPYANSCGTVHKTTRLGSLRLPMRPESVAVARRHVVDVTRVWGVSGDVVHTAELLTSEVVTNAIVHSAAKPESAVDVSMTRAGASLIVECRDPSREIPLLMGGVEPLRESGRGLWLVTTLAHDHGVHLNEQAGKSVWFELVAWP
jgi:anti-sigma regulatory factor (Ser/Thr protein kinase)